MDKAFLTANEKASIQQRLAEQEHLAGEVFDEKDKQEVGDVLHEKGIPLCQQWLRANSHPVE